MNRGSAHGRDDHRPAARGFNEAPIHESGKSSRMRSMHLAALGFNEAPIHESGKSQQVRLGARTELTLQ